MRFSAPIAAVLLSGLTSVFAATHVVTVGKAASLLFEPSSVVAKAGDVIEFQFMSKNHTVTQSTFDKPCEAKAEGVDSGYQLIPAGTTVFPSWSITIQNDTAPLWFYCAQAPHCARGMVFAVNPTAEKTFDKFKATAALAAPPAAPPAAGGAAAGSYGGAAGGAAPGAPAASTPAATTTPPASAAAGTSGNLLDSTANNGALSRAGAAAWPVVLGSVLMGVLVL
jgi:plastocyanin